MLDTADGAAGLPSLQWEEGQMKLFMETDKIVYKV